MMLYSIVIIDTVGAQTFLQTFPIYYSKGLAIILTAVTKNIYYNTHFQNLCILGDHDFNQAVAAK
jgi:hypothetical protein